MKTIYGNFQIFCIMYFPGVPLFYKCSEYSGDKLRKLLIITVFIFVSPFHLNKC